MRGRAGGPCREGREEGDPRGECRGSMGEFGQLVELRKIYKE